MKKLSLVFSLAFVGTFAFAQTTGTPKGGPVQLQKPGTTTTVKTPPSTVAPAPAPTTPSNADKVYTPTSVEKEYPNGQEKQTSPTVKTTTPHKKPLMVTKGPKGKPNAVKSQTIQK